MRNVVVEDLRPTRRDEQQNIGPQIGDLARQRQTIAAGRQLDVCKQEPDVLAFFKDGHCGDRVSSLNDPIARILQQLGSMHSQDAVVVDDEDSVLSFFEAAHVGRNNHYLGELHAAAALFFSRKRNFLVVCLLIALMQEGQLMSPRRIEDGQFLVEPTPQGGVLIRTRRRFCHLPPGPLARDFWQFLEFIGSIDAALEFVQQDQS